MFLKSLNHVYNRIE